MSFYKVSNATVNNNLVFSTNNTMNMRPAMTLSANGTLGIGTTSPGHRLAPIVTEGDHVTQKELDSEVFEMSVEELINLWLARFGTDWVDLETVDDSDFFRLAYKRLKSLGELEQHYLTDRSRYVCRKPD